jgi:hypothetical protein
MVVDGLCLYQRGTMGFGLISPAEYSRLWNVGRKKVSQPIDVIFGRPALVAFSIEALNRDDALVH